jgi:hypothetical protein
MEKLLSRLPEDVIGSGLNKEIPGKALLPLFILRFMYMEGVSLGTSREESRIKVCVIFEAVSFEVSIAMKIYIVIFWVRKLCSLAGGYQRGSCRQ